MDCLSILSSILGGKGGGGSCDTPGGEGERCCVKCLHTVKDKFDYDVTENDKGISINISPSPNKTKIPFLVPGCLSMVSSYTSLWGKSPIRDGTIALYEGCCGYLI